MLVGVPIGSAGKPLVEFSFVLGRGVMTLLRGRTVVIGKRMIRLRMFWLKLASQSQLGDPTLAGVAVTSGLHQHGRPFSDADGH